MNKVKKSFSGRSGDFFAMRVIGKEQVFKVGLRGFISKPRERPWFLLKSGTRDFQNSPPFERSVCFYVKTTGSFGCFCYFIFETKFVKNEKTRFLVESTKTECAIYPHKASLPEANIKTNRMGSTK